VPLARSGSDTHPLVIGQVLVAVILATTVLACADARLPVAIAPTSTCLSSGNDRTINDALAAATGPVILCRSAVFDLTAPVVFRRDDQHLFTEGLPTGADRATLRVAAPIVAAALILTNRSRVRVSHLIIDGGRPTLGRLADGGALIQAGGDASGQSIEYVRAFEPRGWSTLHAYEGDRRTCFGITIVSNEFGPAGHGNGEWADGISLACRGSIVHHNTITDATDGGIVVFGAAGSSVARNTIRAETRPLLGGITMVDYAPFDGDFTGTVVDANTIEGIGKQIRIGIAMGWRIWTCQPEAPVVTGGAATNNVLRGNLAYGYAVNGVANWTVTGNVTTAQHTGTPMRTCGGRLPAAPGPFQIVRASASGTFQTEFADATLDSLIFGLGDPASQPLRTGHTGPID
jgi:hypothetical protein